MDLFHSDRWRREQLSRQVWHGIGTGVMLLGACVLSYQNIQLFTAGANASIVRDFLDFRLDTIKVRHRVHSDEALFSLVSADQITAIYTKPFVHFPCVVFIYHSIPKLQYKFGFYEFGISDKMILLHSLHIFLPPNLWRQISHCSMRK